jgi:hypothetical protein
MKWLQEHIRTPSDCLFPLPCEPKQLSTLERLELTEGLLEPSAGW